MKKPGMLTTRCAGCCGSRGSCSGLSLPLALARGGEVLLGLGARRSGPSGLRGAWGQWLPPCGDRPGGLAAAVASP